MPLCRRAGRWFAASRDDSRGFPGRKAGPPWGLPVDSGRAAPASCDVYGRPTRRCGQKVGSSGRNAYVALFGRTAGLPVKRRPHVVVAGGGIAGLSATIHLLELADAARQAGAPRDFTLTFLAPLLPDRNEKTGRIESNGSGLGGKAMARHYVGLVDEKHQMPRWPFYGPMLPYRGTIPHGYHVVWEYPHLRRMLGDKGNDLDGLLRPPGGAKCIASFQGDVQNPAPGGPGIGLMGLCDPVAGIAVREETALIFRLRGHDPTVDAALAAVARVFDALSPGADPLPYLDLMFAEEIELPLRVALIMGSLNARRCNPETTLLAGKPLTEVEYDEWARWSYEDAVKRLRPKLKLGQFLFRTIDGFLALARDLFRYDEVLESPGRNFNLADAGQVELARKFVISRLRRIVERLPDALNAVTDQQFAPERTLHFRFAPDATFTSPYSFDAAQAVRSLAFCFTSPTASRMQSADGGQWNLVWLRLWERIDLLARNNPQVQLDMQDSRVHGLHAERGRVRIVHGKWTGHGGDLGMPHAPSIETMYAQPSVLSPDLCVDAFVPTMAPGALESVMVSPAYESARVKLAPMRVSGNETLELLLWTRAPIQWGEHARFALSQSAITGLEGAFCLLADYSCGLWSPRALAEEDPFGEGEGNFRGSILESCGGFDDVYACPTRDDAYGWPLEAKEALYRLLSDPAFFSRTDDRPWPHDASNWHGRRASGTWNATKQTSPEAMGDWFVAARWLTWGFVRQLSMIQALGPRAVRQLAALSERLDPRTAQREAILNPPAELLADVRYVVIRNARPRNRIFSPGVGSWAKRPVSGVPLDRAGRVFPAGEWTRNGLDIVCMEAACLSGMRASRAVYRKFVGDGELPVGSPGFTPSILPPEQWYAGDDPMVRRTS